MDEWLQKYIDKYDQFISEERISYSSKVIPVNESLQNVQQILPSAQVAEILRGAELITLAKCICRQNYNNCDKPLEVCFVLNGVGRKWIEEGYSKKVTLDEALEVIKRANQNGLVHLTLYRPDHELFALCSCCSCCCHDLQLLLSYGKNYVTVKSDYVAVDDPEHCSDCGLCIDRCAFNARSRENETMLYDQEKCYGCGLCLTTCPEDAIRLKKR
jgi:NAD-dependent dihydropyrimidine dehydrogenase PreA subunit